MSFRAVPSVLLASLFAISGCECGKIKNLAGIPDSGVVDAGKAPDPPVFPLKAGDVLTLSGVGGRVDSCDGIVGSCERTMKATYTIDSVNLDSATNMWTVNSQFLYELQTDKIEAAAIDPLFMHGVADFAALKLGSVESGTAAFTTNAPPVDTIRANGFPFFQFESDYANLPGSAFATAAETFRSRVLELDADAHVENQSAAAKLEAFFVDNRASTPKLHKVRVDFHPFGFMCGWDEQLIEVPASPTRTNADFGDATPPLAAVFAGSPQLVRDNKQYLCSCFSKTCKLLSDQSQCLDPADPNAAPAPCPTP